MPYSSLSLRGGRYVLGGSSLLERLIHAQYPAGWSDGHALSEVVCDFLIQAQLHRMSLLLYAVI